MLVFAKCGEVTDGATQLKYWLLLKDQLIKAQGKNKKVYEKLIDITWTLIYQTKSGETNPLIPRMLENLYDFKREQPLTDFEKLELFQINLWVKDQIEKGALPEAFSGCIPPNILIEAENAFNDYDKPQFPTVQTDIAKHMLKLRVSFQENQKMNKTYRCDFKLLKKNIYVNLVSEHPKRSDVIVGIETLKTAWLDSQEASVRYIVLEEWENMD